MRIPSLFLALLAAGCAAPPPPPPPAPLPTPITTQVPIGPRLLPGQPPPSPESLSERQLQRGIMADQQRNRLDALDPRRPRQTGEGDATATEVRGDPSLPVLPTERAPIFQRR